MTIDDIKGTKTISQLPTINKADIGFGDKMLISKVGTGGGGVESKAITVANLRDKILDYADLDQYLTEEEGNSKYVPIDQLPPDYSGNISQLGVDLDGLRKMLNSSNVYVYVNPGAAITTNMGGKTYTLPSGDDSTGEGLAKTKKVGTSYTYDWDNVKPFRTIRAAVNEIKKYRFLEQGTPYILLAPGRTYDEFEYEEGSTEKDGDIHYITIDHPDCISTSRYLCIQKLTRFPANNTDSLTGDVVLEGISNDLTKLSNMQNMFAIRCFCRLSNLNFIGSAGEFGNNGNSAKDSSSFINMYTNDTNVTKNQRAVYSENITSNSLLVENCSFTGFVCGILASSLTFSADGKVLFDNCHEAISPFPGGGIMKLRGEVTARNCSVFVNCGKPETVYLEGTMLRFIMQNVKKFVNMASSGLFFQYGFEHGGTDMFEETTTPWVNSGDWTIKTGEGEFASKNLFEIRGTNVFNGNTTTYIDTTTGKLYSSGGDGRVLASDYYGTTNKCMNWSDYRNTRGTPQVIAEMMTGISANNWSMAYVNRSMELYHTTKYLCLLQLYFGYCSSNFNNEVTFVEDGTTYKRFPLAEKMFAIDPTTKLCIQ